MLNASYVYILYINRLQVTEMNKKNYAEGNRFARMSPKRMAQTLNHLARLGMSYVLYSSGRYMYM